MPAPREAVLKNLPSASTPPADAPTPTTVDGCWLRGDCGSGGTPGSVFVTAVFCRSYRDYLNLGAGADRRGQQQQPWKVDSASREGSKYSPVLRDVKLPGRGGCRRATHH